MRSFPVAIVYFIAAVCFRIVISEELYDPDKYLKQQLETCLTENKLDVSILGLNNVQELNNIQESHFENLKNLSQDKRGCFIACLYQKRRLIDSNGRLIQPVQPADPQKKFKTTFKEAVQPCIDEKDFCKLGECVYNVYFL